MDKATIVNLVATAVLDSSIDLEDFACLPGVTYDPHLYGGRVAYYKTKNTKGKVSLFATGKMISVGTTSEHDAIRDLNRVAAILAEKHLINPVSNLSVKIQNIVSTFQYGKAIDLEGLALSIPGAIYEPEQFPGVILKFADLGNTTALVFASGKCVIVGTRNTKGLNLAVERLGKLMRGTKEISY
jgi:transcription initiation factor TFIID TATA-box-binding protein